MTGFSSSSRATRLKRVAIFQFRLSPFRSLFLRMSLSQNRAHFCETCSKHLPENTNRRQREGT
ncbi:hypothetical protein Bra5_CH02940 [Rhizobium phaseoli Brasil 5]|nr:hypothetical protein Bra5_CH02940 [Rhizobium phaseoli Brasil 5]